MYPRLALAVFSTIALGACASIFDGLDQEIVVNTNPAGANCDILRQGATIGHIANTPGSATIRKSKYDIEIDCSKPGYQVATYKNHSGLASASFGNFFLSGLIGVAVDSADGADNHYTSPINITMVPNS